MIKVLLVEDEADLLSLVSETLDVLGIAVTEAETGAKAMEILCKGAPFDFVVSDIAMPGNVSGIDVAHKVQQSYPEVRVILVSGHPLSHFSPLPSNTTFLPKPYRVKQLVELMRSQAAFSDADAAHRG